MLSTFFRCDSPHIWPSIHSCGKLSHHGPDFLQLSAIWRLAHVTARPRALLSPGALARPGSWKTLLGRGRLRRVSRQAGRSEPVAQPVTAAGLSAGAASAPQQHGGRCLRRKPGGGEASDGRAVTARPPSRGAPTPHRGERDTPWCPSSPPEPWRAWAKVLLLPRGSEAPQLTAFQELPRPTWLLLFEVTCGDWVGHFLPHWTLRFWKRPRDIQDISVGSHMELALSHAGTFLLTDGLFVNI